MICSNTRPLLHRSEDLIFADVRLRDVMEGIDLARKVKMRWPLLPVILTSGHPRERVGELPPGVGYMPKPLAAAQSADRYRNKHWHRGFDAPALAQFAPSRCRINSPSARSCSRTGSRSPSIARWQIRRASSSGLMVALPLLLRVIHASSKAVSRITRVSGSKDPLPIPSMFPPYDRGCQEQDLLELPTESSRIFRITSQFGRSFPN